MIKLILNVNTDKQKREQLEKARLKRKEERKKRKVDTNRVTGL